MERRDWFQRVLITGATGSGAYYLIKYIQQEHSNVNIHGTARRKNTKKPITGVTLHEVDLLDVSSIIRCLKLSKPHVIFHMAANPDKGFDIPSSIVMNNAIGSINLFGAIGHCLMTMGNSPIVINVSSSEIFGAVRSEEVPVKEDSPKRPVSPYAVSKLAQDWMAKVFYEARALQVITVRSFAYINPLHVNLFSSDFARQIAEIEQGKRQVLKHGNLKSVRVICDSRDIVRAFWLAAEKCEVGEAYNIGGDNLVTTGDILNKLISMSSVTPIVCEEDPSLLRPVDVTLQVPDCTKFKQATGWQPEISLDQCLYDLLDHWRKEVRK